MTANAKPTIYWDNLLCKAQSITCDNSASDHPAQYLADWREYLKWRSSTAGYAEIKIDLGEAQEVDTIIIYGHNLGEVNAGRYLHTNYSDNGWAWREFEDIHSFPSSNDPVIFHKDSPVSARYWLVVFSGTDIAEISLIFLGKGMEFPCYAEAGFDPNRQELVLERVRSERGYLLGTTINYRRRRMTINLPYLPDSWVRDNFLRFWQEHIPKPFLFSWDRENHPEETYLVELAEPRLELPYNPIYRSLQLELEGRG